MGMMDPGFMQEAFELMKDPAVMKQVTLQLLYKLLVEIVWYTRKEYG